MSTFEPMSEVNLSAWADHPGGATFTNVSDLAKTALHHLARARWLEARRDLTGVGRALGQDEHGEESLISCAQRVRTERDPARQERDDALARAKAAEDELAKVRDTLNPPPGQSALSMADWYRREVAVLRDAVRSAGEARDLAIGERDEMDAAPHKVERLPGVRELLGVPDGMVVVEADSEPAQTFPIQHEVRIRHYGSGKAGAEISINGVITDPAFLALTADQLARLGLVVLRG